MQEAGVGERWRWGGGGGYDGQRYDVISSRWSGHL